MIKNVLVVKNPSSGGNKISDETLYELFSRQGIAPRTITLKGLIATAGKEITLNKYDAVIAMGGDGTIRTVASYLLNSEIPLGIIPTGTYNHLAKDMNIPDDPESCVQLLANPVFKRIDVAEVNDFIFLNNSSLGLYPKAVKKRKKYFFLSKWMATTLSLLKMFLEFHTFRITYCFEGRNIEVITPLAFISNNRYTLNLLNLSDRHSLQEGQLFLYLNNCTNRRKFLKLLYYLLFHKRKKIPGLFDIKAVKECTLFMRKSNVEVAADGEIINLTSPLHYRVHREALAVLSDKESL